MLDTAFATDLGRDYQTDRVNPLHRHAPGEHGMPLGDINPPATARPESVCGPTDDSQNVEQYDGTLGVTRQFVDLHERPVGQIVWNTDFNSQFTGPNASPGNVAGARWCSGTLIADDLFLTAGHCLEESGNWRFPRRSGQIIGVQELGRLMHVQFNYQLDPQGNPRTTSSFRVTEVVETRLGGLDFAILRLAGSPGREFGTAVVSTRDPAIGEMLTIIGHPSVLPKRVEAGPLSQTSGDLLIYNSLDTQPGNSGSGILGANGLLKGVHIQGGCELVTPSGEGNKGVRIESILRVSPTMQTLAHVEFGPASIASYHWVRTRMQHDQWLYTITGNAVVHLRGTSQNFRRLGICLQVPIPALGAGQAMRLVHWAPCLRLGAIANDGTAVDEGYAVDSWGIANRPNRRLTSVDVLARVAIRDTDGHLLRIPFRLTLSGTVA